MAITSNVAKVGLRGLIRKKEIAAPKGGDAISTLLRGLFCLSFIGPNRPAAPPSPRAVHQGVHPRDRDRGAVLPGP